MAIDFFSNSYSALDLYRLRENKAEAAANQALNIVKNEGWKQTESLARCFKQYYENNTSYISNFCSVYKKALKNIQNIQYKGNNIEKNQKEEKNKRIVDYVKQYITMNQKKLKGFLKRLQGAAYESSRGAILDKISNKIKTTKIPDFGESNIEYLNTLKKKHPLERDILVLLLTKFQKCSTYDAFAIAACIKLAPGKCKDLNLDKWWEVIENYQNSYKMFINKQSFYEFPKPNGETCQRLKKLFGTGIHEDITKRNKLNFVNNRLTSNRLLLKIVINICECWWNYPVFMPKGIYWYVDEKFCFFQILVLDLYDYLKLSKPTIPILY